MAGWFYNPPPQPQSLQPSTAPEANPASTYTNNSGPILAANLVATVSTWPVESWSAQRGATVASQLATAKSSVAPIPHINKAQRLSQTSWVPEQWGTQVPIGGGVGGTLAAVTSATQVPAVLVAANAAVRTLWPEPQWDAQAEMTVASIFAGVANPPSLVSHAPAQVQAGVIATWLPEEWRGQSESAIAGGLSQIIPPPVLIPSQAQFAASVAGGALWPRETWSVQTSVHSLAWLPAPITAIPKPVPHTEAGSWPQEQWNAQTGAVVASRLATVQQQIPPLNAGLLANLQSSWPREQWSAQTATNIAGLLAPVKPPTFVNNPPLQPTVFATLLASWPKEDWSAQAGARVASQFSQLISYVPEPISQAVQALWPREDWKAQSAIGVAASLAQGQVAALYTPSSTVAQKLLLNGTWVRETWTAQTGPQGAGWITLQQPVTPSPATQPRLERFSWFQEQWSAQTGATVAGRLAIANEPQPLAPIQQQIVSLWAADTWNAQGSPTVASQLAAVFDIPFVPGPTRSEISSLWPQEQWNAQTGPSVAGKLAAASAPPIPARPAAYQTLRGLWPQEDWVAQPGTRGAPAFAKTIPPVPYINVWSKSAVVGSWPQEAWKAQQAARGAYMFANIGPPPPPPAPNRPVGPAANLGYKVTTRTFNLLEMVSREWGGEFRAPDHRVYEFSNGRAFDSTDMTQNGFYRKN